jgi:putative ABC transport system ATP-binding protein
MVTISKVSKKYIKRGYQVDALSDVSLEVEKGDFIAVVGPSGSGKSTFLLTLGGMLTPEEGKVIINGKSLYEMTPDQRSAIRLKNIGFVFQNHNLVPYLTAMENVQLPLMIAGAKKEAQEKKAQELLTKLGLGDRLGHKPSELSIGQQQRVALARVLANDPPIILADEPTGSLDPESRQKVMSFLTQMNKEGKTIIFVTHDLQNIKDIKHIYKIEEGRLSKFNQN